MYIGKNSEIRRENCCCRSIKGHQHYKSSCCSSNRTELKFRRKKNYKNKTLILLTLVFSASDLPQEPAISVTLTLTGFGFLQRCNIFLKNYKNVFLNFFHSFFCGNTFLKKNTKRISNFLLVPTDLKKKKRKNEL